MSMSNSLPTRTELFPSRRKLAHLWQAPLFLIGLSALVVVSVEAAVRKTSDTSKWTGALSALRESLDRPDIEPQDLLARAEQLAEHADILPKQQSAEAHLIYGDVLLRAADNSPADRANKLRTGALEQLDQADSLGVAPEHISRLWYLLGKAHYYLGSDTNKVTDYLNRSLPNGSRKPAEGYGMLAKIYLNATPPKLEEAQDALHNLIKSTNEEHELVKGRILLGQVLIAQKQYSEALQELDRVGNKAKGKDLTKLEYQAAQASEEEGLWNKAASHWNNLREHPEIVPGGKARILYNLGRCYQNSTPRNEEEAIKAWMEILDEEGEIGQAAALRLAESHLLSANRDLTSAWKGFQSALRNVHAPDEYNNTLIKLEDARKLLELGVRKALDDSDYKSAQRMVSVYRKISRPGMSDVQSGEISEAWADSIFEIAKTKEKVEADKLIQQARNLYEQAAQSYRQATVDQEPVRQALYLWKAANSFRMADKKFEASAVLQEYVKLNLQPGMQAKGLYALAEVELELGHEEDAEKAFFEVMSYSDTPYNVRARYQIALRRIQQNRITEAITFLSETISFGHPTRDAEALEQVIYKLAGLHYQRKEYSLASVRYKEAIQLYPGNSYILLARDQLGDCYRKMADKITEQLKNPSLDNIQKQYLKESRLEKWKLAKETYEKLESELDHKRIQTPLTNPESRFYRKASIVSADIQFDMANYPEALRRYQSVRKHFPTQMEALISCQRILLCYQHMTDPAQKEVALEALKQCVKAVKPVLNDIPADQFQGASSKAQWVQWLNQIETALFANEDAQGKKVSGT